jgi:hypothetical protein
MCCMRGFHLRKRAVKYRLERVGSRMGGAEFKILHKVGAHGCLTPFQKFLI